MAEENQERHYKISKLNFLFAVASLILLAALVLMFTSDYSREWKKYQREFKNLEIEKTRVKYDLAYNKLLQNDDYKKLTENLKAAEEELKTKSSQLEQINTQLFKIQAKNDLVNQQYRFAKAEYDATKYTYEEALTHQKSDLPNVKQNLDNLDTKLGSLRLELERSDEELKQLKQQIQSFSEGIKELNREKSKIASKVEILSKKLEKIDPQEMSLSNNFAEFVRNLPVLDFANPSYKIEQIVLKDITDDVNFMRVPKVDRCITCHTGIINSDYKDAPQPFRTHPNLELFLTPESVHPMEEFGCTVCHGGRGRGTDFVSSVHTPSSDQQKKEWEKKYNWHKLHHWEDPMLPKQYVEAGCFKCHSGETVIKGAEKLNLGLNLIERAGCYGCHTIEKYKNWPKVGPDLTKLPSKTSKKWAYLWIANPHSFRHDTWMPAFFGLSNNSDPESVKRSQQEIHAIVHFLFENSVQFEFQPIPQWGNAEKGKELVASVGCFACHEMEKEKDEVPIDREHLKKEFGPNLISLGSKTSQEWLYNWLKNPERYHSDTRMPNLRLSDQEAADIAAYLTIDKDAEFLKQSLPVVDEKVVNDIVEGFLTKSESVHSARNKVAQMNLEEKLSFAGKKLIRHYGCFACHNIQGFENEKPIGTELTYEGSKAVDKLDFGFIHIDHSKQAWFHQKLKNPRIFDQDRLRAPDEKLRMPNYHFSEEKIEAITTALLGFVDDPIVSSKLKPRTSENLAIEEGQKFVRQFNCQGCHIIEGEGGAIRPSIVEWLVQYDNRSESEAQALIPSFSPPNLMGEGKKVQTEWLFKFLHQPTTIRPWLKTRMPTYQFNVAHLNALIKYFNALDKQDFPFNEITDTQITEEELLTAQKLFSDDYFGCAKCHIVGDKMPPGSVESWAPNFALVKTRLKPEWIIEWLKNPQAVMPGTKMPTFFDPEYFDASGPEDIFNGDEHKQIKALRDYLFTLSDSPSDAPLDSSPEPTRDPAIINNQN